MSAEPRAPAWSYRAMTKADLKEVFAIERRAYEFPWSQGVFRDCIRAGYQCRLLQNDGEIGAYGVLSIGAGEGHLLNLCTRPELWRRGLARALLEHLLERARISGADIVFLEVRPSNPGAQRLYLTSGFREIGVRPRYYPAAPGRVREDALVMGVTL